MESSQDISADINFSAKIWNKFCESIGNGMGTWGTDRHRIWHILQKANLP